MTLNVNSQATNLVTATAPIETSNTSLQKIPSDRAQNMVFLTLIGSANASLADKEINTKPREEAAKRYITALCSHRGSYVGANNSLALIFDQFKMDSSESLLKTRGSRNQAIDDFAKLMHAQMLEQLAEGAKVGQSDCGMKFNDQHLTEAQEGYKQVWKNVDDEVDTCMQFKDRIILELSSVPVIKELAEIVFGYCDPFLNPDYYITKISVVPILEYAVNEMSRVKGFCSLEEVRKVVLSHPKAPKDQERINTLHGRITEALQHMQFHLLRATNGSSWPGTLQGFVEICGKLPTQKINSDSTLKLSKNCIDIFEEDWDGHTDDLEVVDSRGKTRFYNLS